MKKNVIRDLGNETYNHLFNKCIYAIFLLVDVLMLHYRRPGATGPISPV